MFPLAAILNALTRSEPRSLPRPDRTEDHAAVAMIFAGPDGDLQLCFIRRAQRTGDPWSGQMAFPGGRASPADPSPQHVAARETSEEVGLRLEEHVALGRLSDLQIRRRGLDVDGIISPFLYYLGETPLPLRPDGDEVAAAHWVPLRHLWDPENLGTIQVPIDGVPEPRPGILFQDQIIWGLTYRILTSFAEVLGTPLPASGAAG